MRGEAILIDTHVSYYTYYITETSNYHFKTERNSKFLVYTKRVVGFIGHCFRIFEFFVIAEFYLVHDVVAIFHLLNRIWKSFMEYE